MANGFENLKFNITASADDALTAVTNLQAGVEGLKASVATIDTVAPRLVALNASLRTLSNSAKNVGYLINSLTNLNTACTQLSGVNFGSLTENMKELMNSIRPLNEFKTNSAGGVINSLKGIGEVSNSINSIPDMKAFTENLSQLSVALGNFAGFKGGGGLGSLIRNIAQLPEILNKIEGVDDFAKKIENLATALKPLSELGKTNLGSFITQLKKIPDITNSIDTATLERFKTICQELATALGPLATQIQKVGSSFGRLPSNIRSANGAINQMNSSTKGSGGGIFSGKLGGLTRTIGKFWILKTAISSVGNGIKNLFMASADYVEALNLFNVSMGDASQSASEFADRVQSAFGIDKKDWMEYQGTLNMLITGFDVASDKAAIMSQNLTQLAYDYSSLLNVDPSESFAKLQSAMSGQVKGLKAYGNNVSVAMVKQTGLQYGLSGSVSSWDNATQATMRYVTIMNNAAKTNVYNDLARTIVTPANAFRILQNSCTLAIRGLANIASVIIAKIIPYLQLLAQVIARVANFIAGLFGFKLPKIDYSGLSAAGSAADDLSDGLSNTGSNGNKAAKGLKKANKEAKKLQHTTQSWDELHVMPEKQEKADTGSGAGTGGGGAGAGGAGGLQSLGDIALPTYDFFKGLEEDASKRLDRIMAKLKKLFKPITDSWKQYGTKVIKSFKDSFNAIGKLIKSIAKSFGEVWQNGTGKKMFDTIFKIIININKAVANLAKGFTEAWNKAGLGTKIVQNAWNAINKLLAIINEVAKIAVDIAKYINWTPVLRLVEVSFANLTIVLGTLQKVIRNVWNSGGKILMEGLFDIVNGLISVADGIMRNFSQPLLKAFDAIFGDGLSRAIGVVAGMVGLLAKALGALLSVASKCKPLMIALGVALESLVALSVINKTVTLVGTFGDLATKASTLMQTFGGLTGVARLLFAKFLGGTSAGQGLITVYNALATKTGALTTAMSGASGATSIFSGLLSALPVLGVVGAIGALVLALGALASHFTSVGNSIKGCSASVKAEYDAIKQYKTEIDGALDSAQDTMADAEAKIKVFDAMSSKLDELTGKDGYVKNMKEARQYVKKINEIIPNSVKLTKDGKIEWTKTSKEIKKAKENIRAAALEQAKMALYTEVVKKQIQIQAKLNEQQANHKKYVAEANKQYDQYVAKQKALGQQVKVTREQFVANNTKVKENNILMKETEKTLKETKTQYSNIDKAIKDYSKSLGDSATTNKESGKKAGKAYGTGYAEGIKSEDSKKKAKTATKELQKSSQKEANKTKITVDSKYKDDGKAKTKSHKKSMQKQADKDKISVDSKYKDNGVKKTQKLRTNMQNAAKKAGDIKFGSQFKDNGKKKVTSLKSSMQSEANLSKNKIKMSAAITGSFYKSGSKAGANWLAGFKSNLNTAIGKVIATLQKKTLSGGTISVKPYATGGLVPNGQMFLAREAGPELVGRVGNRTAVMNNDQIVEAVANGVGNVLGAYMPEIINAINSQNHGVYLDGRELTRRIMATKKTMGNDFGYNY